MQHSPFYFISHTVSLVHMADTNALVIGGTGFIGRHTVVKLCTRHDITTLSQGTNEFKFPDRLAVAITNDERGDNPGSAVITV